MLVDNYVDIFLPSEDIARYPIAGKSSQLLAEQGLSVLIEAFDDSRSVKVLYDFGRSVNVLKHNMDLLDVDTDKLDYLVLSHGHVDHYGSLEKMLATTPDKCRLILHPNAYGRKRFIRVKEDTYAGPWKIEDHVIKTFHSRISESIDKTELGCGIYVSGQIDRIVEFEKGTPNAFVESDRGLVHDEIMDDQSIFVEIEGRGILVLTGCCHAGLINTILAAEKSFPWKRVFAVVGGLHLNNAGEEQMQETIKGLKERQITYLSAIHCTGYYASMWLMEEFRNEWIPGTVGATFTFQGT